MFIFIQRSIEDLLSRQAEVNEHIQMSEDDVAQVNDLLSRLQDSKEVRTTGRLQLNPVLTVTLRTCVVRTTNIWQHSWMAPGHSWRRRFRTLGGWSLGFLWWRTQRNTLSFWTF